MQNPEIEWQLREVDVFAHRVAGRLGRFVQGIEVGTTFHLNHRETLAVIEIKVAAVLQEGTSDCDGALIVEG